MITINQLKVRSRYDSRCVTSQRRLRRSYGFNLLIARNYYNFDRQIRVIPSLPDGSTESFTYDHKGRLIKQTSFEGVITVYTYDEFDRVSSKTFFENQAKYFTNTIGETWTYEYDQFGRVTKINQNGRETITEYDAQGRTISVTTPEGKISYTYDAFGRQTSVQTDNDPPTVYSYDSFGRLSSVTSDGKTTTYEYDAFGNLARTKLPNGVVTTYEYDNMNRLIKETNFADKNNNGVFDNGEGISQFDYTLDAQGRKTNAIEKFWADLDNDGVIDELFNNIKWGYDNAGRLVYEEFDHYDDAFDQTQVWEYDLVSNRTLQKLDRGNDGIFDEITKYNYDINDRLLEELFDGQNDGIFEKLTLYAYDHTQQTSKTVSENGVKTSETTYEYDLQGRMSVVTITTFDVEENITRVERTSYDYGADGIRTSALHEIDANGDGTFETSKLTEYLNDPLNITGYSQVLKQTETDLQTGEYTITTYVIGHQRISQTVEKNGESSEYYFTFDGHGSTRVLTDIAGVVVQLYAYDAFGNVIAFDPSTALTEFLYSGEQFDAKIGQQYLRQRYYDPATGRFNRLDPFFGNTSDPLSLHKYLYTHGDPVNGIDPNGLFGGMVGVGISMAIGGNMRGMNMGAVGSTYSLFSNIILPVLQMPVAVMQAYQEVMQALTQFKQALADHFSRATISFLGWQTRIKKKLNDNADIVIAHGLRPDYGYDVSGEEPIGTWRVNGVISVSFTLKLPVLLNFIPILGQRIQQTNNVLGERGSIMPVFNYTFTFLKGELDRQTTNIWDIIKLQEGSARMAMRGSLNFGSIVYFAEIGGSTKHGLASFSNAFYSLISEIGFTGRIVRDVTTNDHNGTLSSNQSTVRRWTIFQFKWGGTADGSDAG